MQQGLTDTCRCTRYQPEPPSEEAADTLEEKRFPGALPAKNSGTVDLHTRYGIRHVSALATLFGWRIIYSYSRKTNVTEDDCLTSVKALNIALCLCLIRHSYGPSVATV
ncbi:hypothetical protein EYF80_009642 [Liparis tanakae]|uniref:Uncharacterized protein n=1 Tax=Liparis tanakae TaxID=230148 RepID=A0A4Z2IQM2_9TELE|nr:hypothetical protein EYF80_009642 [Liparis tanakae]